MKPLTENALVLAAGVPTNVPSPDHPKRLKTRTASGALIVAFAIGTTTPAVCQDQLHGWKLISQSSAISLIGVEETPRGKVAFSFKNVSSRSITAYTISIGNDPEPSFHSAEWFEYPSGPLAPGAAHQIN